MVEITSSPDQEAAEGETPLTGPQRQTDSRVAAGKTAALTGGNLRLRRGLLGSAFAAICCFTPLLVVILAGAGLSAIVGWLDYALFPMLFASLGVVAHALWRQAGQPGRCPKNLIVSLVIALSALLFWLEFRFALRVSVAAALAVAGYALWLRKAGEENGPGHHDSRFQ